MNQQHAKSDRADPTPTASQSEVSPALIRSARIVIICLSVALCIVAWAAAIHVAMRVVGQ